MGRKKSTLEERHNRMTKRRRIRYDDMEPFIMLFKPSVHHLLTHGKIGKELKALLKDGDETDFNTLTYLEFRLKTSKTDDRPCCTLKQVHQCLHRLLDTTGSSGTMYGKAMIIRYIANGHSNLNENERCLQSAINKAFK